MKLKWSKESGEKLNDDGTMEFINRLGQSWRLPTPTEVLAEYALHPEDFKHEYVKCSYRGNWVVLRRSDGAWGNDTYTLSNYVRCVREIESEGE